MRIRRVLNAFSTGIIGARYAGPGEVEQRFPTALSKLSRWVYIKLGYPHCLVFETQSLFQISMCPIAGNVGGTIGGLIRNATNQPVLGDMPGASRYDLAQLWFAFTD